MSWLKLKGKYAKYNKDPKVKKWLETVEIEVDKKMKENLPKLNLAFNFGIPYSMNENADVILHYDLCRSSHSKKKHQIRFKKLCKELTTGKIYKANKT